MLVVALAASPAGAQFDLFDWNYKSHTATGGGIVTEDTMTIVGADLAMCPGGSTNSFTTTAPYALTVIASYSVDNDDEFGSGYDFFVTLVDGADTVLTDDSCNGCELVLEVPAGAVFGFGIRASDCSYGPSTVTLSNFHVEPAKGALHVAGIEEDEDFGASLAGAGDVDGDGAPDVLVGAPFADAGGFDSGRVALISGQTGLPLLEIAGDTLGGRFGAAVSAGDIDADGLADLIVGAPLAGPSFEEYGVVQVFSGADGHELREWTGTWPGNWFGAAVAHVGDIDLDGVGDVLVGAPLHDVAGSVDDGMARLFSGADGSVLATWEGAAFGNELGRAVAGVGDIDGDGVPEVIVGAPKADDVGLDAGHALVFSGGDGSLVHSLVPDCAGQSGAQFGKSVAGVGDLDGDGSADMAVGAPGPYCSSGFHPSGGLWVFSGHDGSLLFKVKGGENSDKLGIAVAAAGDVDGDGLPDVVAGSPQLAGEDIPIQGKARAYSAAGSPPIQASDGDIDELYGTAVAVAGDIDLDGLCDLAVGAPEHVVATTIVGQVSLVRSSVLWTDLGAGLAGMFGMPQLVGTGLLAEGELTLELSDAAKSKPMVLVIGLSELGASFKGGLLVPQPDALISTTTDGHGHFLLHAASTGPLPTGQSFFLQAWIVDAGGPAGYSASTALRATVP